jgi:hypothetical protein
MFVFIYSESFTGKGRYYSRNTNNVHYKEDLLISFTKREGRRGPGSRKTTSVGSVKSTQEGRRGEHRKGTE